MECEKCEFLRAVACHRYVRVSSRYTGPPGQLFDVQKIRAPPAFASVTGDTNQHIRPGSARNRPRRPAAVVSSHKRIVDQTVLCLAVAMYLAITGIPIFRADVRVNPSREQGSAAACPRWRASTPIGSLAGVDLGDSDQRPASPNSESRRLVEEYVKR